MKYNSAFCVRVAMAQGKDNRMWHIDFNLDTDTVYINEYFAGEMASPFGGVKKSGIGRERGLETLANYTRVKNVAINIER